MFADCHWGGLVPEKGGLQLGSLLSAERTYKNIQTEETTAEKQGLDEDDKMKAPLWKLLS